MAEILRALRAVLVGLALRLPISWVNILVGPAVTIDGRTLDTRVQWFLKLLKWMDAEPVYTRTVDEVRETMDGVVPLLRGRAPPVGQIIDRTIVGGLRVRIYRPAGSVARLLPTILYFHGGGWVTGSLEGFDLACRYFCARSGCVVISVDYRLAPESKFPAAIEDARTAFDWVLANAASLGIDPARIVVAGDSAGANIATVLAQATRSAPQPPCLQWLIYPATDLACSTASWTSLGDTYFPTRTGLAWYLDHYLNDMAEIADPRVSPLRAPDLTGLPPTLVYTAGFDPLRDEGQAYANAMQAAGVKVVHREFDSLIHGFVGMNGVIHAAARAMDDMVAGLRHELAQLGP